MDDVDFEALKYGIKWPTKKKYFHDQDFLAKPLQMRSKYQHIIP